MGLAGNGFKRPHFRSILIRSDAASRSASVMQDGFDKIKWYSHGASCRASNGSCHANYHISGYRDSYSNDSGALCFARNYSTSGPFGVEGRLPNSHLITPNGVSSSLSITDPFILYQSYVANGTLKPDEQQLRAAKEFQKLYLRVKDYKPPEDMQIKISLLIRKIELNYERNKSHSSSLLGSFFGLYDAVARNKSLIKVITDEEELENFPSPHGLIINGEVGCGKSMLMDIFATTLPHHAKMRWHYNNFMLWVYNEIHVIQQQRIYSLSARNKLSMENEFLLFEVAQKLVNKSNILLLDEFMLPDIAAANIVKILFTFYFKLGGVLVATSNRLPEELYSTSFKKQSFNNFVSILQTRCVSMDMKSSNDYRRILSTESQQPSFLVVKNEADHEEKWDKLLQKTIQETVVNSEKKSNPCPDSVIVYGRKIQVPWTLNGIVRFDYDYICGGHFASSDYITLASRYHTFVIDNIPVMNIKMKNEARRFISLLDALYEAKCKLLLRTDVALNELFFPEKQVSSISQDNRLEVQDEEMFAKTQMELSNPYRPNVSTYDQQHTSNFEYKDVTTTFTGQRNDIDFKDLKAFTGEDEKFAFKRAVSRIIEMTSSDNWRLANKWVPIDRSMRPWESTETTISSDAVSHSLFDDTLDNTKLERLFQSKSIQQITNELLVKTLPKDYSEGQGIPFRKFNAKIAPIFDTIHFWSMGVWGKGERLKDEKAKKWIRGHKGK